MRRTLFILIVCLVSAPAALGQAPDGEAAAKVEWAYANQSYLAGKIETTRTSLETAQTELARLERLYAEGLVPRRDVERARAAVDDWQTRLALVIEQKKVADTYVAMTEMIERATSQRDEDVRWRGVKRVTRHYGRGAWSRADFENLATAFRRHFGRALPISALGQTATHSRLGLDHGNRMDIAVHPDSEEGRWIMEYLRSRGIPFIAFVSRIAGSATGPHIHVGLPSCRL